MVVAILYNDHPVIGLILAPCDDKLYWAIEGAGAFCNDKPIHVDERSPFDTGLFVIGPGAPHFAGHVGSVITRLMEKGGMYMRFGSAARSLALVASGHLLAFYEPALSAWDCLAGQLLVREAGGQTKGFEDGSDRSIRQPVLAVAPQVADTLESVINA